MKIMFICTGNICRSAMAHIMFEKKAKEKNKNIEVYSSGIECISGWVSTDEAIEIMKEYGLDLTKHRSTSIYDSNIKEMDLVLCATRTHKGAVIYLYPELKDKIYTMKEYAGYDKTDLDIQDPWGYGIDVYRKCAKEIDTCLDRIIDRI